PSGSSTSVGLGVGEEDAVAEATAADGVAGGTELNGAAGVQTARDSEIAAANEPDASFLRRATHGSMSLPSSGPARLSSPVVTVSAKAVRLLPAGRPPRQPSARWPRGRTSPGRADGSAPPRLPGTARP